MTYVFEFFYHKFTNRFVKSTPLKIGNDVTIGDWEYEIDCDFWSPRISVKKYIKDNKFFHHDGLTLVKNNHVVIFYDDGWCIWFQFISWLSELYIEIYGDYEKQSFASLKEAKERIDSFFHKVKTLKAFL